MHREREEFDSTGQAIQVARERWKRGSWECDHRRLRGAGGHARGDGYRRTKTTAQPS